MPFTNGIYNISWSCHPPLATTSCFYSLYEENILIVFYSYYSYLLSFLFLFLNSNLAFYTLTRPHLSEMQWASLSIHDTRPTCNIWRGALYTLFLKRLHCPSFPISSAPPFLVCSVGSSSSTWCLKSGMPQAWASDYLFSLPPLLHWFIPTHGPPTH